MLEKEIPYAIVLEDDAKINTKIFDEHLKKIMENAPKNFHLISLFRHSKQVEKKFIPYLFSANQNYNLICKQITKFKPKYFIIFDYKTFLKVKSKFKDVYRTIILNKLEKINFKSTGEKQVVNEIMKDLRKTI